MSDRNSKNKFRLFKLYHIFQKKTTEYTYIFQKIIKNYAGHESMHKFNKCYALKKKT